MASIFHVSAKTSADGSCIKVIGPLDFSLTGILAGISSTLADTKISLFAKKATMP